MGLSFSTTIGSATGLVFGKVFSEFLGQDDYYYFEKEALRVLEMNNNNVTGYWKNPKTGHEGIIKISGYYGDPECRLLEHPGGFSFNPQFYLGKFS